MEIDRIPFTIISQNPNKRCHDEVDTDAINEVTSQKRVQYVNIQLYQPVVFEIEVVVSDVESERIRQHYVAQRQRR